MDTIMNYNTSSGSQLMPEAWLERTGAEVKISSLLWLQWFWQPGLTQEEKPTILNTPRMKLRQEGTSSAYFHAINQKRFGEISMLKWYLLAISHSLHFKESFKTGASRSFGKPLELFDRWWRLQKGDKCRSNHLSYEVVIIVINISTIFFITSNIIFMIAIAIIVILIAIMVIIIIIVIIIITSSSLTFSQAVWNRAGSRVAHRGGACRPHTVSQERSC